MNKILSFLKNSHSWLVLLPLLLVLVGAASNQAVLIANHGKFPVMLNERQRAQFEAKNDVEDTRENAIRAIHASQDAHEIFEANKNNKAVEADAKDAEKASKATVRDYEDVFSARESGRFDKLKAAAAQSKIDADKAVAAEEKAEKDAETVPPTTDVKKSEPKELKAAPAKKFSIMNTAVHMNDIQGQFLDDVHSVMGPNSHLKGMADVFDLGGAIYSIGDFGIMVGGYFWPYLTLLFVALNLARVESLKNIAHLLIGIDVLLASVELLPLQILAIIGLLGVVSGFGYVAYRVGKGVNEIKD